MNRTIWSLAAVLALLLGQSHARAGGWFWQDKIDCCDKPKCGLFSGHKKNDCGCDPCADPCDPCAQSCAPCANDCCPEKHCKLFHWHKKGCPTEDEKLNDFWHGYYRAMSGYYCGLSKVNWVTYYNNYGSPMNGDGYGGAYGCSPRIHYTPVFMTPNYPMQAPCNSCGR